MARLGRFENLEYADYAIKQIEFKDKIRKLLFGSDQLVELGYEWGLLKRRKDGRSTVKRRKKRSRR